MKVEFNWRDYDDYAKWLNDALTTLYEENEELKVEKVKLLSENQQLKKQKDDVVEYIKNYDVFKEFSFPLMKKWEENQVKSSIDYQFKESIKKDLLRMLGEEK